MVERIAGIGDLAEWLRTLTSEELVALSESAEFELLDRAAGRGDLDAVLERAFRVGFDHRGVARHPWVEDGLVICPGSRNSSSSSAHRCRFVAVGDLWAWQSGSVVSDEMRPQGGDLRTVTIMALQPGLELDVVTSSARNGAHRRQSSVRFRVVDGSLVEVSRQGAGAGREHR
jgi:hypothetical protein